MSLEYFVEANLPTADADFGTFYAAGFSPSGRYIITNFWKRIWTLDREDESCITAFDLGANSYGGLAIDNDGTVYAITDSGTSPTTLYSWTDFANGSQSILTDDAALSTADSLSLFAMPDDSRKVVWLNGGTGPGSADISIWDVSGGTLTDVANATPGGLIHYQMLRLDTYGDVWAVGSDADNIYFQRVIDNGAGSGSPDYVAISDPGHSDNNQIEAYHTSAGWFVVRGGGTDLFLLGDADFSELQHRSYALTGSSINAADLSYSPFLMGLAPGADSFWFPGPNSFADASYSDLHNIVAADLTTAETHDIADWEIGDDPIETGGMVFSTYRRLALISNSSGADDDANVTVLRYLPESVSGGDSDGVTDDDIRIRVWTYSLDGHDYFVLRLGPSESLVYDLTTGTWSSWESPGRTNWRAHIGCNWVGMSATTLNRGFGSDVVAGDDASGVLWILDPTSGRDDRSTTGDDAFTRIVTGGVQMNGRDVAPCGAVTVDLSIGAPTQTGATIMLESSDDLGHNWNNHGSNIIAASDYSATIEWRSLGTIHAPGRVFRITDNGAAVRLSGMDMR